MRDNYIIGLPHERTFIMSNIFLLFSVLIWFLSTIHIYGQNASTSDYLKAQAIEDRTLFFDGNAMGISKTVQFGADLAWPSEQNYRRSIRFMGIDQVDVTRVSFQATHALVNGDLQQPQIEALNNRLSFVQAYASPTSKIVMNSDSPTVDPSLYGNPTNWTALLKATATRIQDAGYEVVSIGPMNEPDYSTNQGTIDHFYNIVTTMRNDPFFDAIRISGGNVLNNDLATEWYEYLRPAGVNEGNTHQLAGNFNSYASFFETVTANGDWASNDELHNVMEALVGYQYGMKMGIWWGHADYARGEMVKAFDGERLAYAEHRPNWTAAAVYRTPAGKIQAFGGTSERQATTTTFNYVSKDKVVYFDGQGPQREFAVEMPGGTGYWTGQTNAERVVNITWGDDIQPEINGRYKLVNRANGMVMQVAGNTSSDGTNVQQASYSGSNTEQWDVYPVASRIGGDFSYYHIIPVSNSNMSLDLYGFNLDDGANISQWTNNNGGNQQWYLEYQGDGWFYVRNRESSFGAAFDDTGNLVQQELNGSLNQQWRLMPINAQIEFNSPAVPSGLIATALSASIELRWTANSESDLAGYHILRAESSNGDYNTIGRNVVGNTFVDNTTLSGIPYYYKIQAEDLALNRSDFSSEVTTTLTPSNGLVAHYSFNGDGSDNTENLNHSSAFGGITYGDGIKGSRSVTLNGTDDYIQLPTNVASFNEITIASWVYRNGGEALSRIFEFNNADGQTLYLTPENSSSQLYFGIGENGSEQGLGFTEIPTGKWIHIAVTMDATTTSLYVNGILVNQSQDISLRPSDINPIMNYLGRSRNTTRLLNGSLDDFRIYNYALSAEEIAKLAINGFDFEIVTKGETCPDQNNGEISIESSFGVDFDIDINNQTYGFTDGIFTLGDLAPGTYDICLSSTEYDFEQCYTAEIGESDSLTGKISSSSGKVHVEVNSGTAPFQISLNGIPRYQTNDSEFEVFADDGDVVEVKSDSDCEGVLSKRIMNVNRISAYPNPNHGVFEIVIPTTLSKVEIEVYDLAAKRISSKSYQISDGKALVNLQNEPPGIYVVKINSEPNETIRIVKN